MKLKFEGWKLFILAVGPLVVLTFFGLAVIRVYERNPWASLFGAFLTGASIGLLVGGFAMYYDQLRKGRITLPKIERKKVKEKKKNPLISKISVKLFRRNMLELLSAGISETPSNYYYKWATYFFYALIASVPGAFIASFILKNPLPLAIMITPFVFLFAPQFQIKSAKGDRKRAVDEEIPFFALFSATLADAGISLYDAFKRLLNAGLLKSIEKDALYLVKAVEFLGQDHVTALDALARTHPSKMMSDLLFGYTSELRAGGDVARFLMDKAEEFLRWLEFRFEKYGDSVSDIGEMITALFFILPTLVLAMAFVNPGTAVSVVWLMDALVIPIIGVAIIFQIRSMQPRSLDIYSGDLRTGIIVAVITGAIVFILKAPIWAVISASATAGTMGYSFRVYFQKRIADEEENSLEPFIRDITEYRKSGYSIPKSIERLAQEGKYAKSFMDTIKSVSAKLQLGFRLSDIRVGNSWLGRQIFFLLGQIDDTGGGSARELEMVHTFVERYLFAKRAVKSRMRIYQMLMIFTPVGLALLIFVMSSMVGMMKFMPFAIPSGFSIGSVSAGSSGLEIPPMLFQASYIMVIIASIFMSLSGTEASDFTIKNMWRVSLTVLLASFTIFALTTYGTGIIEKIMPLIPSGSGGGMFSLAKLLNI